jgi:hypothetical protein
MALQLSGRAPKELGDVTDRHPFLEYLLDQDAVLQRQELDEPEQLLDLVALVLAGEASIVRNLADVRRHTLAIPEFVWYLLGIIQALGARVKHQFNGS